MMRAQKVLKQEKKRKRQREDARLWKEEVRTEGEESGEDGAISLSGVQVKMSSKFQVGEVLEVVCVRGEGVGCYSSFHYENLDSAGGY